MTYTAPGYVVDIAEPGFMHVVYREMRGDPETYKEFNTRINHLWIDRRNLAWLVAAIQDCLSVESQPRMQLQKEDDQLTVREWGSNHEPFVCIFNARPIEGKHPTGAGQDGFCLGFPLAAKLVAELEQLVPWKEDGTIPALSFDPARERALPQPNDVDAERRAALLPGLPIELRPLRMVDSIGRLTDVRVYYRQQQILLHVGADVEDAGANYFADDTKNIALLRFHNSFEEIRRQRRQLSQALRAIPGFDLKPSAFAQVTGAAWLNIAYESRADVVKLRKLAKRLDALQSALDVAASAVEYTINYRTPLSVQAELYAACDAPLAAAAQELPLIAPAISE
jgi:hypothetical protein